METLGAGVSRFKITSISSALGHPRMTEIRKYRK